MHVMFNPIEKFKVTVLFYTWIGIGISALHQAVFTSDWYQVGEEWGVVDMVDSLHALELSILRLVHNTQFHLLGTNQM